MRTHLWFVVLLVLLLPMVGAVYAQEQDGGVDSEDGQQFFRGQVKPLIEASCLKCHGLNGSEKGGLQLTSRDAVMRGGELGPAIDLDEPADSVLLEAVNYASLEMPPSGKLSDAEIAIFRRWIERGLPWGDVAVDRSWRTDRDDAATAGSQRRYSIVLVISTFVPPRDPAPQHAAWVQNPVDAFILNGLEQAGLSPAPPRPGNSCCDVPFSI